MNENYFINCIKFLEYRILLLTWIAWLATGNHLSHGKDPFQEQRRVPEVDKVVTTIALAPDGTIVAMGWDDGAVTLRSIVAGQTVSILSRHSSSVTSLTFSADGKTLASGDREGIVRVWDLTTRRERAIFDPAGVNIVWPLAAFFRKKQPDGVIQGRLEYPITLIALSPDGQILAYGRSENILVFNIKNRCLDNFIHQRFVNLVLTIAFSPDGRSLVVAGSQRDGQNGTHGTIDLWDVTSGKERASFREAGRAIRAVAFSPDGKTLATGGTGVSLWDLSTGRRREIAAGSFAVLTLAYSPDGRFLGSADTGGIKIWATDGNQLVADVHEDPSGPFVPLANQFDLPVIPPLAGALAFSPDGTTLAVAPLSPKMEPQIWHIKTMIEFSNFKDN